MRLVVTGGVGFIGSSAVCRAEGDGHAVLTVDKLTYAGRMQSLDEVSASPRHQILKADITDSRIMDVAFDELELEAILHLAAESHVDRSIDDPNTFITTNVQGTFILLEAALRYWSRRRNEFRFIHISTDEVFGSLGEDDCFDLDSRYAPNSPYAASETAARLACPEELAYRLGFIDRAAFTRLAEQTPRSDYRSYFLRVLEDQWSRLRKSRSQAASKLEPASVLKPTSHAAVECTLH